MMINNFKNLEKLIISLGLTIDEQNKVHLREYQGGKDIESLDEVISANAEPLLDVSPTGEIRLLALFISQSSVSAQQEIYDVDARKKYHLFNCRTLSSYPKDRKYRYKTVIELNGFFPYHIIINNKEYEPDERKVGRKLNFCQNCNSILQSKYGNYGEKRNFKLKDFVYKICSLKTSDDDFVSGIDYDSAIGDLPRTYPVNWKEIATRQKELLNWKCQDCSIDLSSQATRRWLDAHHIDGDPSHSIVSNIRILCIGCHAGQLLHSHVKGSSRYSEFISYRNKL